MAVDPLQLTVPGCSKEDNIRPECSVCGENKPEAMVKFTVWQQWYLDADYCPECDADVGGGFVSRFVPVHICRDCALAIAERLA